MPTLTLKDGTEIWYKDWGNPKGEVVTFSHGWPLNADNWDSQAYFLASQGYRVVAHDRRGHGRSSQPWEGNDLTTYADDLQQLFEHLDLRGVTMVGHSTGGGEVARYVGKYGTGRVARAVLISAITPLMVRTEANPEGLDIGVFDSFRDAMVKDRAQFFLDVPNGPFFGFNRPGAVRSEGLVQSWWLQGMMAGFKNTYDCIKAFSETDLNEDLAKMDIPVLVLHGDDDQVVPIQASAQKAIKVLPKGTLKVYPGGPHALPNTHADQVNKDILDFIKA
ncbi:Alpha/Beta hydrolase protein [Dactylonectria estremocensis]|uniref:Alpha/Beta hydrolase protein n=1 Tax=Dactylonectria estremocensis TaxID=1079267 RepID=A0A9P9E625_9HYPO|nr:Alpha/Beta hydrolase protein [Dactylonectria estremocensis]